MSVGFIFGRAGAGKSALCRRQALAAQEGGAGAIYIVPEQTSLQTEQALCAGGAGLISLRVLSFRRLAYAVLAETGAAGVSPLEDVGKSLILRRALNELKDKLVFFKGAADKPGFAAQLTEALTEFYRYGVEPEALLETAGRPGVAESRRLRLLDLYNIFTQYRRFLERRFLTHDGTLDLLADRLPAAASLKGARVWIDGFFGFTPQEYRAIEGLAVHARSVTIALTTSDSPNPLFDAPRRAAAHIREAAARNGVPFADSVYLNENFRHGQAEDLRHLERAFFSPSAGPYAGAARSVELTRCADVYDELEHAAKRVKALAAEGVAVSEVAIVTDGGDAYAKAARAVFGRHGLPLFIDAPGDGLSHPLIEYIRAVMAVTAGGWRYESVFRLLKTGLTALGAEDVDILENYVLARGIRYNAWQREWTGGFGKPNAWGLGEAEQPAMNALRLAVLGELSPFTQAFASGRHSVADMCRALYGLISAAPQAAIVAGPEAGADVERARADVRVWSQTVDLLDQCAELLGQEAMTAQDFARVLESGFAAMRVELAPPTVGVALFGDLRRTLPPEVKALFILGANDGRLPAPSPAGGALTDGDRAEIEARTGVKLAPFGADRAYEEWLSIYNLISKPSRFLSVSYAARAADGKAQRPSVLIDKLREALPYLTIGHTEPERGTGGEPTPAGRERLSEGAVAALYEGRLRVSVSKLERYAGCPFAYFAEYNLRARERAVYEVARADLGNALHAAFKLFAEGAPPEDDAAAAALAEACVDAALAAPEFEIFKSSARAGHMAARIRETAAVAAVALARHAGGAFTPLLLEGRIAVEVDAASLEGRVDRVDAAPAEGGALARVFDYKSGAARLNYAELYYGLRLQLPLYMHALTAQGAYQPAGVFYVELRDKRVDYDGSIGEGPFPPKLLDKYKPHGAFVDEPAALAALGGGVSGRPFSKGGFARLTGYASAKAADVSRQILSGDVSAAPFRLKGAAGCDWCPYMPICGGGAPRRLPPITDAEALERIMG